MAAILLLAPSLSMGSGFALFEVGNRGMAMGGAMTAVADDPSAMYWNVAGLGFQIDDGVQIMGGVTLITAAQDFYGESPYPGDGYTASQKDQIFYPPHFYVALPVSEKVNLGFSLTTPFGLGTYWDADFAGRWISKRVNVQANDLSFNLAWKVNDWIAFGAGFDYRISTIDLTRNIPFVNPYTQEVIDVGQVHMFTEGAGNTGNGYHAGFLAKLDNGISLGINYHSRIKVNYEGYGSFTQFPSGYADFDALLQSEVPFGQKTPLTTSINFPDSWSIGGAWANEKVTISLQWGLMGWDTFQELAINFTDYPQHNATVRQEYDYTNQVRLGMEYRFNDRWAMQAGALYDETPQPTQSMSPLLGDGDRTGFTIGASWNGEHFWIDTGYMYLPFESRSTDGESWDGYDGSYDTMAHLLGMTFGYKF